MQKMTEVPVTEPPVSEPPTAAGVAVRSPIYDVYAGAVHSVRSAGDSRNLPPWSRLLGPACALEMHG